MKGKTKQEKGITLIALIITIVVLLILAAVAISSITNDGILGYATNAAKDYNQAVKNEQSILQEYEGFLANGGKFYDEYKIGDKVKVGSEEFYVIADSNKTESKVLLLAKEGIDTTNLVQGASTEDSVQFSSTSYWSTIEGITYPYDLVETGVPDSTHYAAYAAYQYGVKLGGRGRLMYYSEVDTLSSSYAEMICGFDTPNGYLFYWLGSAADYGDGVSLMNGDWGYVIPHNYYFTATVRPVVEISKSKVSLVTE